MEQLPKIVQRRLQGAEKPGDHPDPNLLAAFAEKSLNDRERSLLLQHLAECAGCRDVVALAIPETDAMPAPLPGAGGARWLSWPVLRWGALAACVVVVSAAVTLHYGRRQGAEPAEKPPAAADATVADSKVLKPGEELAAKLPPASPIQSDREFVVAGNLAKQRGQSMIAGNVASRAGVPAPQRLEQNEKDQLNGNRLDSRAAVKSSDQPSAPALVAAAPAPLPAGRTVAAAPVAEARNRAADYVPKTMTETVTVEGAATAELETAQTAERKKKEKDESSSEESQEQEAQKLKAQKKAQAAPAAADAMAVGGRAADALSAGVAQTTLGDYAKRARPGQVATRWTLSDDGALQHSFDSGKTWQTIQVANNLVLRALAVDDSDIWVGGAAGALYHSSDAGRHWIQVIPEDDGKPLTSDIVTLEFSDPKHGKLTTATRETWTTDDAGGTWQKR
ncbi:MAG TPA: YCF48-related protein [Terriglobales bacterium]|nr:YCF48-related protein [Terriglobales bacterium]